jgi:hypothetical protein
MRVLKGDEHVQVRHGRGRHAERNPRRMRLPGTGQVHAEEELDPEPAAGRDGPHDGFPNQREQPVMAHGTPDLSIVSAGALHNEW